MLTRFGTEDILDSDVIVYFEAGVAEWLSRWPRDPRSIEVGKPASGLRARRGSNPFPGANLSSSLFLMRIHPRSDFYASFP